MIQHIAEAMLILLSGGACFLAGLHTATRRYRKADDPEYYDELYMLKPDQEEIHRLLVNYLEGMSESANQGRR